jgi:hypothetical protein
MRGRLDSVTRLLNSIVAAPARLVNFPALQRDHMAALDELKEKEAFNFALFQYSPVTTVVVDRSGRVVKTNIAKRRSGDRLPNIGDLMYKDYASKHTDDMRAELLVCIKDQSTKNFSELAYGDKILSITIAGFPGGAIITSQDITAQKQAENDRIRLISDLRKALDEVEQLRGLLPICASCKKIRDDKGYWNQIEDYISHHTNLNFSHTICPECMQTQYPDLWVRIQAKQKHEQEMARQDKKS